MDISLAINRELVKKMSGLCFSKAFEMCLTVKTIVVEGIARIRPDVRCETFSFLKMLSFIHSFEKKFDLMSFNEVINNIPFVNLRFPLQAKLYPSRRCSFHFRKLLQVKA
jgi:hypothetical protein